MATAKKTTEQKVDRFEELRQRAISSGKLDTSRITDEPFVLGEDWGFKDTPIEVEKPTFTTAELISENVLAGRVLNALRVIFGGNTSRVTARLDTLGDEAGPAALLLVQDIMDHFYGPGAVQIFPR